jgi:hypothetical protein
VVADTKVSSGATLNLSVSTGSYRISSTCVQLHTHVSGSSTPNHITVDENKPTTFTVKCWINAGVG